MYKLLRRFPNGSYYEVKAGSTFCCLTVKGSPRKSEGCILFDKPTVGYAVFVGGPNDDWSTSEVVEVSESDIGWTFTVSSGMEYKLEIHND